MLAGEHQLATLIVQGRGHDHEPGDTLYPQLTIAELKPQRTTGIVIMTATLHNQRGELVLTGEHKYLLRK